MGKTKTSFVGGVDEQPVKPSYDKAAKEAKRKAREATEHGYATPVVEKETIQPEVETPQSATSEKHEEKKQKVRSQKYRSSYAKVDKKRIYSLPEAIKLIKETSYSSFDGTMELHILIRKEGFSTNVTFPHSFGKQKRVVVANDEVLDQLKNGKIEFDVLLATPDMMPKLVPFARLLGPRGLMPNPKNGTLIKNVKEADTFSTAATSVKTEKKAPVIHIAVGKVSQDDNELAENIETLLTAVGKKQIQRLYLKSTMSPSVKVVVA